MYFMYKRVNCVVANSARMAEIISSDFSVDPAKIAVIPNGIDFSQIDRMKDEPVTDYVFDPGRKAIISVGRLAVEKNYPLLLYAFQRLKQEHADIDLLILGEGVQRNDLQQMCKILNITDNVHFMGFQANPYKYMKNSQAYVLSSNYEGFPNSLLEAMYVMGNVIATDCEVGPSQIITNNIDGILTKVGDVNELAAALEKMLYDQQFKQEIHRNSRSKIINFSHQKMVSDYRLLLER
jgi:glycosyltransferase involved in cell wall biosynthesis